MILVRRRRDLANEGLLIPTFKNGAQALDEWRPASQPDELDGCEFNLILFTMDGREVYDLAIAIDFEFGEDIK